MNFEQLEYVKEVVETKSMSLAAQKLHVSQSAISQSILLLEKEIGLPLFKRSRLGTVPTEEGKQILKKMLEILKKVDEIKEEVHSVTSSYAGELKIATIPSMFMNFLPKVLSRFKKDFPQIKVSIMEMESIGILEELEKQQVDIGLIAYSNVVGEKVQGHVIFQPFHFQGEFRVIVSKDSPLAWHQELFIEDIVGYPFVLYSNSIWKSFEKDMETDLGKINVIFSTTNTEVIKRTVSEGLGISLLSSLMLRDDPYVESGRIISIPLKNFRQDISWVYGWAHSQNSHQDRLIKKFLEYSDRPE